MNAEARAVCVCTHPAALHVALVNGCRLGGCRCERFRAADAPEPVAGGPQRVTVDVPPGFLVSFSLIPMAAVEADDE